MDNLCNVKYYGPTKPAETWRVRFSRFYSFLLFPLFSHTGWCPHCSTYFGNTNHIITVSFGKNEFNRKPYKLNVMCGDCWHLLDQGDKEFYLGHSIDYIHPEFIRKKAQKVKDKILELI